MKKILCVIISALTLLTLFAACSNCQFDKPTSSEKDDIFSDKDDNKVLEDASALSFYKEFVGGTGYKVESSTVSHYEYEGGEMSIDFAIINQAAGFECGLFVILNGVFQQFTFKGSDGKATAEGYMQIIDIPAKERVTFTLNFTPNTGKKGDILNIAVGTLTEPSYTSVYTGWPRYAKYGQHGFAGVSGMTLIMNSDGTGTAPSETAAISKAEITDEYYDLLTGAKENDKKAEAWRSNYAFALYYDKYDENRDLIAVPETESVNLKLDVLGKEADYRISVFVNNEIVRFENDRTYFEVHNTTEKVTHIEFPVNIFSMAKNSHIYTVVSEKDNDNSSATYGTFVPIYKTSTYYFIKGEVSEVTSESKTDVAEENTSQQNGTIGIGKNEIAALSGMELLYVDSVDGNTICCVVRDENMNKKALFLNKDNSAVIGEADLEENAMYYGNSVFEAVFHTACCR